MPHSWTERDDLKALYLYLYGTQGLPFEISQVALQINTTEDSLKMRIGNFKDIDIGAGLSHAALQSRRIFKEYHKLSIDELRYKAFGFK